MDPILRIVDLLLHFCCNVFSASTIDVLGVLTFRQYVSSVVYVYQYSVHSFFTQFSYILLLLLL